MTKTQHRNTYRIQKRSRKRLRLGVKILILAFILLCATIFFRTLFAGSVIPTNAVPQQSIENCESSTINILPYTDRYYKIVWLDAGHGGFDTGTYVVHGGTRVYEKDITLDIVLKVYELFQQSDSGVKVFLTRADDSHVRLSNRTRLWNNTEYIIAKADLVVSVHVDYYEGQTAQTVSGVQVNYNGNQTENTGRTNITNAQFAQILQNHLVSETGARDRYIRGDRGFTIVEESTMPAVLIETGFMSNSAELSMLLTEEYRMSIARAIYNGIVEAFQIP